MQKVIVYISDYSRPYFRVTGTLRRSRWIEGNYVVDDNLRGGSRVFPLSHREVEVYDAGDFDRAVELPK